jgi:hypothetical protein
VRAAEVFGDELALFGGLAADAAAAAAREHAHREIAGAPG